MPTPSASTVVIATSSGRTRSVTCHRHAVPHHQYARGRPSPMTKSISAAERGRARNDHAREIHLRDEIGAADHAGGAVVHGVGEICPRQQAGEREQRIRNAVGRARRRAARTTSVKMSIGSRRLNNRPQHAERRLLVAQLDVAPGQKEQQLAMLPHAGQIERHPSLARRQHEQRPIREAPAQPRASLCPFAPSPVESPSRARCRCAASRSTR